MTSQRPGWKPGFLIILLFWAAVSFTDYPAPFIDDLSYVGAAMNLVLHGTYSNPYCEMLRTVGAGSGQLFLDYMPIENYFVAGWLTLFGISTSSFHVLFTLFALLASLLVYRFLPAARFSWAVALLICVAVYGLLGGVGLRADALGLCFYLVGCDAWREKHAAGFFVKNLFLGLTVITFPNLALLAMFTSLAALLYQKVFRQRTLPELVLPVVAMGAAYALCFLLFLVCIHGHLFEFLSSTVQNQKLSALGVRDRFQFFTALGISKWVVVQASFLVLAIFLIYKWRKITARREDVFFLCFCLVGFAILGYSSVNSASGAHIWAFACLMIALYLMMKEKWDLRAWGLYCAIFAIGCFGHFHVAIQHVLADPEISQERRADLLAQIERLHPARLYVDVYAMRELYDYKLPPNALAFETSSTTGWGNPKNAGMLPKGTVSVVSVSQAFPTPASPDAGKSAKPLKILGRVVPGVTKNPYDLEIIDNR